MSLAWTLLGGLGYADRALASRQSTATSATSMLWQSLLRQESVDTVIHLAAQTLVGPAVADPVDTFEHNVAGTWSVLEACRTTVGVARIVVASSDKAYGDAGGREYTEQMALQPRAPYDTSKAAADLLGQSYAHTYELPVAISRCANLYGEGDRNWSRIIPGTIRSVLAGSRPVIRSDGSPVRDYLYVGDASTGVIALADAVGVASGTARPAFNFSAAALLGARGGRPDPRCHGLETWSRWSWARRTTRSRLRQSVRDRAAETLSWRPADELRSRVLKPRSTGIVLSLQDASGR